eukprot:7380571-Prymnesium_polylepis.1
MARRRTNPRARPRSCLPPLQPSPTARPAFGSRSTPWQPTMLMPRRGRATAVAIARAESYLRPTPDGPRFMRIGARAAATANSSSAHVEAAADSIERRCAGADAACHELREALLSQGDEGLPGFAEFCRGLALTVSSCSMGDMPASCLNITPPAVPPTVATSKPYHRRAQVHPTPPIAEPQRPKRPPGGWWPWDVHDIVKPWALERIAKWFRALRLWHERGGPPESRPRARAFGPDAVYARARGYPWDLRGGPGKIRLWGEDGPNPVTDLDADVASDIFADCKDRELVSMIIHGVTFKVTSDEIAPDEQLQPFIVLNPNLLSMYSEGALLANAKQVQDMCGNGWMELFPDAELGLVSVPLIMRPRGIVTKKGTLEMRGICDNGAPRKRLCTDRSRLLVESPNVVARRAVWHHEDKPTTQDAAANGTIVRELGVLNGEPVFEIALDFSKFFHRLGYRESELWQMGVCVPYFSDAADDAEAAHDTLAAAPSAAAAGTGETVAPAMAPAGTEQLQPAEAAPAIDLAAAAPDGDAYSDMPPLGADPGAAEYEGGAAAATMPSPVAETQTRQRAHGRRLTTLAPGIEYAMTMGATPASQIGQRLGDCCNQKLCVDMDAEGNERWAAGRDLTPACRDALEQRALLPHDSFGSMAKMYDILQYTDDVRACVAGVDRTIRLLRHYRLFGPGGLNLPLSRADKQQAGAQVLWNGCRQAAAVGLVWVPPSRSVRMARDLAVALAGESTVGDYRQLLGQLASVLFMVGGDDTLLHHIFRPVTPGHEIDEGPEALVRVDDLMRPVLERWQMLILRAGGCPTLNALRDIGGAWRAPSATVAWR